MWGLGSGGLEGFGVRLRVWSSSAQNHSEISEGEPRSAEAQDGGLLDLGFLGLNFFRPPSSHTADFNGCENLTACRGGDVLVWKEEKEVARDPVREKKEKQRKRKRGRCWCWMKQLFFQVVNLTQLWQRELRCLNSILQQFQKLQLQRPDTRSNMSSESIWISRHRCKNVWRRLWFLCFFYPNALVLRRGGSFDPLLYQHVASWLFWSSQSWKIIGFSSSTLVKRKMKNSGEVLKEKGCEEQNGERESQIWWVRVLLNQTRLCRGAEHHSFRPRLWPDRDPNM